MVVDLQFVLDQLNARRGQWPQIAREQPEFSYSWLQKLATGRIEDPGIRKIAALERYFRLLVRQEDERKQLDLVVAGG